MDTLGWFFAGVVCALCAFALVCIVQDVLLRSAKRKELERQAANEKVMQDEKEYWAKEREKRFHPVANGGTGEPQHRSRLTAQNAFSSMVKYDSEPCSVCKAQQGDLHRGWCSNVNPLRNGGE